VNHASPADVAASARTCVLLDDDPIADQEIGHALSDLHDGPGVLVAEHDRGVAAVDIMLVSSQALPLQ
jgi:hypothetical protein